jgi:transcriptional regulator with XRE-family HTH domain
MKMSIFSQRLRNLRKLNGNDTQEFVANALEISRGMLSNYELGTREPDFKMLCRIADYYNVSTDYLLGRSDHALANVYDNSKEQDDIWNSTIFLSKESKRDIVEYAGLLKLRDEKEVEEILKAQRKQQEKNKKQE